MAILFGLWAANGQALAQQLIIESPDQGPVLRVIYGKITATNLYIFENKIPLELEALGGQVSQKSTPGQSSGSDVTNAPTVPSSQAGVALTSFFLSPEELIKCVRNPRFKGLLDLAKAMSTKIQSVVVGSHSEAEACAAEVARSLASVLKDAQITQLDTGVEGVSVQLGLTTQAVAVKAPPVLATEIVTPPEAEAEKFEEILKNSKINIGDQQVKPNAEGYFVAVLNDVSEVNLETYIPGRIAVQTNSKPILLSGTPYGVTNGEGYSLVVAQFSKPMLNVVIGETAFLAKKTTLDGGLGGGVGYGRQVPGERKGQRTVALIGLERREIFDQVGARAGAFYSRSPKTVVPQTLTVRASGFYDRKFFDDDLVLRVGAGMELFMAKIKHVKSAKAVDPNKPQVLIPEQVSAPLVSLAIYTVLFDWAIMTPSLVVTPLYVPSVGFYPSINPSIEVGVKIKKKWLVVAQAGSETHRFPSVYGETKLQLDFTSIALKIGL